MNEQSVLQALLGQVPAAEFIEQHYLRLPYHSEFGVAAALAPSALDSFGLDLFLGSGRDLIVGRQGEMRAKPESLQKEEVESFLADGYTIGLRHAQKIDDRLEYLARSFGRDVGGHVDIHLYWTPAGKPGFGWHYDAEEVFVLQLAGSKTWSVRKNTVNPWPLFEAIPLNQRYEREIMPIRSYELVEGSWLYIPSGYWHSTSATEQSLSMSVGIRAPVAIDVLDHVVTSLRESIEWRERMPCVGAAAQRPSLETDAAYREILERLATSFAATISTDSFRHSLIARCAADNATGVDHIR